LNNILLVGNGPNYFSQGVTWKDVIRSTARIAHIENEVERLIEQPLPIVYERIASEFPTKEREARAKFVEQLKELKPNEIHESLMNLKWRTVLTTNYDHSLEAKSGGKFHSSNLEGESTYSVFRRKCSADHDVWHIHGDTDGPRTLRLGLHEYAGYMQKLRGYLTTRSGSRFAFGKALEDIELHRHSWADLFLRDDVHIVGLGLGYEEFLLWWLIGFKQRLKYVKNIRCGQTTYYLQGEITQEISGRLDLLSGLGVQIKHISSKTGKPTLETWGQVIKMLKQHSHT
jgi:hypothetical protein